NRSPLGKWLNDRALSFIVLIALTAASFYLTYIIFRPFLASLFLSFVLSIAFLPVHNWISSHDETKTTARTRMRVRIPVECTRCRGRPSLGAGIVASVLAQS